MFIKPIMLLSILQENNTILQTSIIKLYQFTMKNFHYNDDHISGVKSWHVKACLIPVGMWRIPNPNPMDGIRHFFRNLKSDGYLKFDRVGFEPPSGPVQDLKYLQRYVGLESSSTSYKIQTLSIISIVHC